MTARRWSVLLVVIAFLAITMGTVFAQAAQNQDAGHQDAGHQDAGHHRTESSALEVIEEEVTEVPISNNTEVLGLDVSHFQKEIDWNQVAATGTFAFVYIKATEGIDALDPLFAQNWQGAAAVGLLRGAYHFYEPADDPMEQAHFFLETIGALAPDDLPPALDVEVTRNVDTQTILDGIRTWLEAVEKATGRRPLLYTGLDFWNDLGSDAFGDYPLWLAEYETDNPVIPNGWRTWTFWQDDEAGTVPGIDTAVDLDRYAGSLTELMQLTGELDPAP